MTGTPIWLLDVDGVLNAFDDRGPVLGDWDDWEFFSARGFPMRYSPAMCSRIRALHETGQVEIRWLTTWGRHANTDLTPMGFPQLKVAAEQPLRGKGGWWKFPPAKELFDAGHALIWTDDDLTSSQGAVSWLRHITTTDRANDVRAYAPQGAISQQDMGDIEAWLAAREVAA